MYVAFSLRSWVSYEDGTKDNGEPKYYAIITSLPKVFSKPLKYIYVEARQDTVALSRGRNNGVWLVAVAAAHIPATPTTILKEMGGWLVEPFTFPLFLPHLRS